MRRGEVWIADLDVECPVVMLSADGGVSQVMRIVEPATDAERRGFVLLSGQEALSRPIRDRVVDAAGPGVAAVGIEVGVDCFGGLPGRGVIRVVLAQEGRIFCTWQSTLTAESLIRRLGVLEPPTMRELDNALKLAGI